MEIYFEVKGENMQEYSQEKLNEAVEEQVNEFQKNNKKPSVLLMGQTGTGKTTAATEYIFGTAEVGDGAKPCTIGIKWYDGKNINIYDSEGYEIGKQEHYRELVMDGFLKDPSTQGPDGIQVVWYFVSGAGKKITDYDISLIKEIQEMNKYQIALVISKIDEMSEEQLEELKRIAGIELPKVPVFQISMAPAIKDNPEVTDWNRLTEWTWSVLGEVFQSRFVWALRGALEIKKQQINKWILAAATSAAGIGAAPIPFADAPVLAGLQGVLIFKILRTYNVQVATGTVTGLISSLGVSQAGRWLCGQLLKFVPVLGNIANATVAAAITYALGKAVDTLCQRQAKQMLAGEPVTIDVDAILGSKEFATMVQTQFGDIKDHILDLIKGDDSDGLSK